MKLDTTASGVYSIAPTPFLEDGAIDWKSVDRMTDFYFEAAATVSPYWVCWARLPRWMRKKRWRWQNG